MHLELVPCKSMLKSPAICVCFDAISRILLVMSRLSQNYFQHSIIADNSQNPRISLTFRLLKPKPTLFTPPNPVAFPVSDISVNNVDVSPVESNNVSEVSEKITLYVGDSMFRHFSANKLSTSSQKAVVLSYPGATVNGVLAKLKTDPNLQKSIPNMFRRFICFVAQTILTKHSIYHSIEIQILLKQGNLGHQNLL